MPVLRGRVLPEAEDLFPKVYRATEAALPYFPELAEREIFVSMLALKVRHWTAYVVNCRDGVSILRWNINCVKYHDENELAGIASHELSHVLQFLGEEPKGERGADLISLSRCGAIFTKSPSYLNSHGNYTLWDLWAGDAQRLAQEALERRIGGHRNAAAWWEHQMHDLRWGNQAPDRGSGHFAGKLHLRPRKQAILL